LQLFYILGFSCYERSKEKKSNLKFKDHEKICSYSTLLDGIPAIDSPG
jgi:hypothetical protein